MTNTASSPECSAALDAIEAQLHEMRSLKGWRLNLIRENLAKAKAALLSLAQGPPIQDVREKAADAIRTFCRSLGAASVQVSADGVERIYYSGISIVGLADAILANAAPANRSTAKATANVGDNGERMGSEPAMGIVTGGSDPTRSMMPSTDKATEDDCDCVGAVIGQHNSSCPYSASSNHREGK